MTKNITKTLLGVAALVLSTQAATAQTVKLNEIYASHSGTDDQEMIELIGPAGTLLDGYMVLIVEGEGVGNAGTLDRVWDLTGLTIPASGYFVLGDTAVSPNDFNIGVSNSIENGTETFYLVTTANTAAIAALLGTQVDADGDFVTDIVGLATIEDIVAIIDPGVAGGTDFVYDGAQMVGPDGSFFPAGIFRDGDFPGGWCLTAFLDFDPIVNLAEPRTPGGTNSLCPTVTTTYCTAGTSTAGCTALMGSVGLPSLSNAGPFTLTASTVEGQKQGIIFYSISGQNSANWGIGGTSFLCVKAPTQRTPVQSSGGTNGACDGSYALDWNAYVAANPLKAINQALAVGTTVDAQAWYRDPPNVKTTSLSNGIEFTVQP